MWLDGRTLRGLTVSQRANEIDAVRGYLTQHGDPLIVTLDHNKPITINPASLSPLLHAA